MDVVKPKPDLDWGCSQSASSQTDDDPGMFCDLLARLRHQIYFSLKSKLECKSIEIGV